MYIDPVLTDYIATRWYRAPEVLLAAPKYGKLVDIWGFGCILAELYLSKPLFPGSSTLNQIQRILELTGVPTEADLQEIHSPLKLSVFEKLADPNNAKGLKEMIPEAPADALDLIQQCLEFRPSKRPTATDALSHPFVKEFHEQYPEQEKACLRKIKMPFDDNEKKGKEVYQEFVHWMVKKKNAEIKVERRLAKYLAQ